MILKASQRAGGTQLALHLLKTDDNEHVEIHEIRGFISDNLVGAFKEAHAVSKGTRCRQFLFSLSLSPPETAHVPIEAFEQAIADIEEKMNLTSQPRAIVFHEKEGRRHAHCVWSRIDVDQMKAINLPHYKLKLRDISRQLYLEHGWQMPRGLMNSEERNPLNFSQAEWQQAKRAKQDPRALKEMFRDCWAVSDNHASFENALKERGFFLAKGDRRGHVAVDWRGEIYAISRWLDVKAKDVRARLGDANDLPSVETTRQKMGELFTGKLRQFCIDAEGQHERQWESLNIERTQMVAAHRQERDRVQNLQAVRKIDEIKARTARLPTGFKALWFRLTGKYQVIAKENETEAERCAARDQSERQELINRHLKERRNLQHEIRLFRHHHAVTIKKLNRDIGAYLEMSGKDRETAIENINQRNHEKKRVRTRSP